jgi:hypothetical protein
MCSETRISIKQYGDCRLTWQHAASKGAQLWDEPINYVASIHVNKLSRNQDGIQI